MSPSTGVDKGENYRDIENYAKFLSSKPAGRPIHVSLCPTYNDGFKQPAVDGRAEVDPAIGYAGD